MTSNKDTLVSDLISRSRNMLAYAEAGEWEKVVKEEAEHRRLLEEFFAIPADVQKVPGVADAISEMLTLNERLQEIAISARKNAQDGAESISSGRRAIGAYAKNVR